MKTGDQLPARDAEGYLIEPAEWNETVAVRLADVFDQRGTCLADHAVHVHRARAANLFQTSRFPSRRLDGVAVHRFGVAPDLHQSGDHVQLFTIGDLEGVPMRRGVLSGLPLHAQPDKLRLTVVHVPILREQKGSLSFVDQQRPLDFQPNQVAASRDHELHLAPARTLQHLGHLSVALLSKVLVVDGQDRVAHLDARLGSRALGRHAVDPNLLRPFVVKRGDADFRRLVGTRLTGPVLKPNPASIVVDNHVEVAQKAKPDRSITFGAA